MGKITGFLEFGRVEETYEPKAARKQHYREFIPRLTDEAAQTQVMLPIIESLWMQVGPHLNHLFRTREQPVSTDAWRSARRTVASLAHSGAHHATAGRSGRSSPREKTQ